MLARAPIVLALLGAAAHADPLADQEQNGAVIARAKALVAALDANDEQAVSGVFASTVKLKAVTFADQTCRKAFRKNPSVRRKHAAELARCLYPVDGLPSTKLLRVIASQKYWDVRVGQWYLRFARRDGALVIVRVSSRLLL